MPQIPSGRAILTSLEKNAHRLEDVVENAAKATGKNVTQEAKELGDRFYDGAARLVGVAELTGFRYSVKEYKAQVSATVWRGSRLDANDMAALKQQGIKSVVSFNLEGDQDPKNAAALGMQSHRIGVLDNTHPTFAQVKDFLDFATTPANQPVYAHCEAGKGRTGIFIACYQMAANGMTEQQALADARKFGLSLPNQEKFIHRFAEELAAGNISGYPKK